jgi:hypothetical protein
MTAEQAMNYERVVIDSAKDWINGEATIGNQMELVMIADHYGVRLPACMYHFQYSENPNHVCATGAFKTIYKTLDKLAAAINARVNNG